MTSSPPFGRIKGSAIRELVLGYEQHHDASALRELARTLPKELGADLDPDAPGLGVLATRWYDARVVHAILDATLTRHPPEEQDAILRDALRAGVRNAAHGIYAFLIGQLASPELYARNIPRLWRMLQDTGERRIELVGSQGAISLTRGWRGHHPLLCRVNQFTMATLLETMGKRDVEFTAELCVSDGASECRYRFRWR